MAPPLRASPRIALVIDRFDGRRGGAALWTRGFAAWLGARGCDVHVIARSIGPAEELLPIVPHVLSVERSPWAFTAAAAARLAEIRPQISHDMGVAVGCDVFHPHFGSGLACWQGSVASYPAWLRPLKRLCSLSPRRRRLRRLSESQFRSDDSARSEIFVAVSEKTARDMQLLHGVPAEQIRIVRNGVDLGRFTPEIQADWRTTIRRHYHIDDDEVVLIAAAHNFRLKGIPRLIRAVARLRRRGDAVKLLVCGGRAGRTNSLKSRRGGVIECGRVADVAPYYAAADICVHPTFYDACSLVTLEAMAAGLPVVSTGANGASELITNGRNGAILDGPFSANELAAALEPLIRCAVLRRTWGAEGRRTVTAHTVERNYDEIAAAYVEVLLRRSASPARLGPLVHANVSEAGPPMLSEAGQVARV